MGYKKRRISLETITNDHGVKVKKACMSCAFKDYTRTRKLRFCNVVHDQVSKYHCCEHWEMSESLEEAGSGRGVVRDKVTKEVVIK